MKHTYNEIYIYNEIYNIINMIWVCLKVRDTPKLPQYIRIK